MIIRKAIAALLVAGASTLAIAVAPLASAARTGPICVSTGANSTLCQSAGNAQLDATPPPVDYQQYPFFGPYGLLFHHGGHHR